MEEGGQRWSKPHVASLMMEALQDLQAMMSTCPVLLDMEASSMAEIAGTRGVFNMSIALCNAPFRKISSSAQCGRFSLIL